MKSMTFGELPTRKEFKQSFQEEVGDGGYTMSLRGYDAKVADELNYDHNLDLSMGELYDFLEELVNMWGSSDELAEEAGDLASGILSTLGFEWI